MFDRQKIGLGGKQIPSSATKKSSVFHYLYIFFIHTKYDKYYVQVTRKGCPWYQGIPIELVTWVSFTYSLKIINYTVYKQCKYIVTISVQSFTCSTSWKTFIVRKRKRKKILLEKEEQKFTNFTLVCITLMVFYLYNTNMHEYKHFEHFKNEQSINFGKKNCEKVIFHENSWNFVLCVTKTAVRV